MKKIISTALVLALLSSASVALAAEAGNDEAITKGDVAAAFKPQFSPYAGRNFPTRPLFGDTHLHTAISVDAGTLNRIGQEDAFRFARGEEVTTTHGLRAKLGRPLDFLVISDHAEMYGLMPQLLSGDPEILSTDIGRKWYKSLTSDDFDRTFATAMEIVGSLSGDVPPIKNETAVRNAWQAYTALADKYNEPEPVQRHHRLRMDRHRWLQPPSQRAVPRQLDDCQPDPSLLAVRQQEPRGLVEIPGGAGAEDRLGGVGNSAQRQPKQRPHVHSRDLRRQAADQGPGGDAHQVRATH